MLASLEIIPFEKNYANAFKALNTRWLKEFFKVEPIDEKVLSNVDSTFLKRVDLFLWDVYKRTLWDVLRLFP